MAVYTWDPANKDAAILLSNGNLTATRDETGAWDSVIAAFGMAAGKWYWEITMDKIGTSMTSGVGVVDASTASYAGSDTDSWSYKADSGEKVFNAGFTIYGDTWEDATDVVGVALDMDNNKLWFSKNGVFQASGDPAAGTNEAFVVNQTPLYPMHSIAEATDSVTVNFGATAFAGTPPVGFLGPGVLGGMPPGRRGFTTRSAWRHKR